MNSVQDWGNAIALSFLGAWQKFIGFIPSLIAAIIVLVVGWIISAAIGQIIERIVAGFKIDAGLEKLGIGNRLRDSGWRITIAKFIGGLAKWFLILVFLLSATNILGLDQVSDLINRIILYIPNVIVAIIILAVSILVGNFFATIVAGSTVGLGDKPARILSALAKWAVIIFGLLAALLQLGIAPSLVNTILIGIVAMFVIAGGLAFGLGGQEEAALFLRRSREKMDKIK